MTRLGCPMEMPTAPVGVAGGAPPAAVYIEYCCAHAKEPPASSKIPHSFPTDLNIYNSSPVRVIEG
jgi:hypothetical protein